MLTVNRTLVKAYTGTNPGELYIHSVLFLSAASQHSSYGKQCEIMTQHLMEWNGSLLISESDEFALCTFYINKTLKLVSNIDYAISYVLRYTICYYVLPIFNIEGSLHL